ncbi:MAG TPA: efflux RND transporter periplasmic adaptor subunit [Patescibacteria group bacterium]|nr:efflux RND transporter periplasmic adaptor subunit [Patescibacteria group bacterium]
MSKPAGRRLLIGSLVALGVAAVAAVGVIYYRGAPAVASQPAGGAGGPVEVASTASQPASTASGQGAGQGAGQDPKDQKDKKAPVPVSVASLVTGTVSSYITSTANLITENEVKVLAEAEGRLAELRVEEGMRVTRGQMLASLAREDAEIALNKAQVRATNAHLAHDRAVKALAEDLLSRESFDKVAMEKDIADQELAEARWRLEKTTIRAPFAGRITERSVKLGQHVRPGDPLFTVADFDPLIAKIYLPEKDIYGLSEGREVHIMLKANEAVKFDGRIRQISPVVDTATGTVKVTVEAVSAPADVRPGAFVTIDIVHEVHPRAVLVPREAVIREMQEAYVFIARGEVAEKRPVSLGLEESGRIEAVSGLKAGEQVVVAGQGGLKDGTPIRIIPPEATTQLGTIAARPVRG